MAAMGRSGAGLLAVLLAACVSGPPDLEPGEAAIWGRLRLVPREGAAATHAGYGDRRLRGVETVDYSRPGFSVLYVDTGAPVGGELALSVVDGAFGVHLEPAHGVVGRGGFLQVSNRSAVEHVVSAPRLGVVSRVAPGGRLRIEAPEAGELEVHVLDARGPAAKVFVAPGPWTVVDASGRYQLRGLAPGSTVLRAWNPRFPPTQRALVLSPGAALRVDVDVGVGLPGEASDAP